jgi:hypothetical protein
MRALYTIQEKLLPLPSPVWSSTIHAPLVFAELEHAKHRIHSKHSGQSKAGWIHNLPTKTTFSAR